MNLNTSLSIASDGLAVVQAQMAIASQNVANASTPGYVVESLSQSSRTADGQASGVITGLAVGTIDSALQASLYTANAQVSALTTISNSLTNISALQGSTSSDSGSSSTLADQLGNVQASLISLESNPSNTAGQQAVVSAATTLAQSINATSSAYQADRQAAQESIGQDVSDANASLAAIGSLSTQIMQEKNSNISTADLESQRATAMTSLSNLMSVQFKETPDGDMAVTTASGLVLPTRASSGPLVTSDANLDVGAAYPGSVPAITLSGRDITSSLSGGTLGANIQLRDVILPTMQGELDSFSQALASRFDAQGLTLFSDSGGNLPGTSPTQASPAGQLGFSAVIQVTPSVVQDPSLIRDGSHAVTGAATGATSFTVNTNRGSGDTTLINRLIDFSLGVDVQAGITQPSTTTTGLGLLGTLAGSYSGAGSIVDLASSLASAQASTINDASTGLATETSIRSAIAAKNSAVSGVSVDQEMSSIVSLQNSYAANAKVVSAVQSMFTSLLAAIP